MKSIFIIGPSGSGKSTLTQYLSQVYKAIFGSSNVLTINLDPANPSDQKEKVYDIDVNNLITLQDIMEQYQIGPNGSIMYAMDFLYQNIQWLNESIKNQAIKKNPHFKLIYSSNLQNKTSNHESLNNFYILFDLPGQIELYLNHDSMKKIVKEIQAKHTQQTCLLQLFDSTYIYNVNDFVSLCTMSLVTMTNFQMPHISLLNKIDIMKGQRPALGMLNDYFQLFSVKGIVQDLTLDDDKTIVKQLAQILDQFGQVSFLPCSVYRIQLIKYLIFQIEKIFNTHQINLMNSKYSQFTSQLQQSFGKQRLITSLQNYLFEQDQAQEFQEVQKVLEKIKKSSKQKQ